MVKGISRRVVVSGFPGPAFLSRRSSSCGTMRPARASPPGSWWRRPPGGANYAGGDHGLFSRIWRDLFPAVYTLMGAAEIGLVWLTVWLI